MFYYEVAPTKIVRSDSSVFTYASDKALFVGQIVSIEVGRKYYSGVVIRKVTKPRYATKSIITIIEETPLPESIIKLSEWLSGYYGSHLATVLQTVLPRGLQKTRRSRTKNTLPPVRDRTKILFNNDQLAVLKTIENTTSGSVLLHGVTGSGKTAVYIEAAKQTLAAGKSVIVLVPEIALTSQLVDEFSSHFDNIILTHSKQTEAERHQAWREALTSDSPTVIIGPRSALFMPVTPLGLVVIDEAHEPSFKQEQSPRYSALRAASILTKLSSAKLVLGSATPLVTDYYLAKSTGRPLLEMPNRARKDTVAPKIKLVDMTKRTEFKQHRFLSDKLLASVRNSIESGHQALVFHNRRGSASTTLCENCGWSATCPRCFVPLILHADHHKLRCHICGFDERVPTSCPVCHSADIIHKGIGTKLIEAELKKLFPNYNIARFDSDADATEGVESRYKELYEGNIDIIVGTQVIAKGLDLPKLRVVGVVQADAGLSLPDYSSPERTFQLLAQVIGRVGRSHHPTDVIVQSYQPDHYAVKYGLQQDYANFYEQTIAERRRANFPPFCFLLKLTCIYRTEIAAIRHCQELAKILRSKAGPGVEVLGPTPAFYERQRDTYRWQLTVKSSHRANLIALLEFIPPTHWQFELDPVSLL